MLSILAILTQRLVRFIKSSQYKPKLKSYATSFSDHKADLLYLVTQKSTVGVTQMKGTLSDVSAKVDKIVDFLFTQSPKEQEVTDVVKQLGGETAVVKVIRVPCSQTKLLTSVHSPRTKVNWCASHLWWALRFIHRWDMLCIRIYKKYWIQTCMLWSARGEDLFGDCWHLSEFCLTWRRNPPLLRFRMRLNVRRTPFSCVYVIF